MEEEQKTKKNNTMLYVVIAVVAIVIIAIVLFFVFTSGKSIKDETITAENYQEMLVRIEKEIDKNDDDLYYLSYGMLSHMMQTLASSMEEEPTEESMYKNIYGKTLKQLIDDGKEFMEENNVTLEQFKEQVGNTSSLFNY